MSTSEFREKLTKHYLVSAATLKIRFFTFFSFVAAKMSVKEKEDDVEKGTMDKTEKEDSVKKDEGKKDEKDQDVVFVQDVGFTVKIVAPNLEPFDVQVKLRCT